eukprot:Pgem_evm1s13107
MDVLLKFLLVCKVCLSKIEKCEGLLFFGRCEYLIGLTQPDINFEKEKPVKELFGTLIFVERGRKNALLLP